MHFQFIIAIYALFAPIVFRQKAETAFGMYESNKTIMTKGKILPVVRLRVDVSVKTEVLPPTAGL